MEAGERRDPSRQRWFTKSATVYDAIYESILDYDAETELLMDIIGERRPGAESVLEVGCGTGQFLARLRRDFGRVVGVDVSEEMVAVCRARHPECDVRLDDMRTFDLGEQFDAVLCLFASVGYVRTLHGLQQATSALARHLAPGGVLVLDGWIRPEDYVVGHRHALTAHAPGLTVSRHSLAHAGPPGESMIDMAHLVSTPEGFDYYVERHEMGLFADEDVVAAMRAAGLEDIEVLEWRARGRYVGSAP